MELENNGSGVTGDEVDETTMEHRNIRPVAWARAILRWITVDCSFLFF